MIDPHPHPGSIIAEFLSCKARQFSSLQEAKRIMASSVDYNTPTAKVMNAVNLGETRNHFPLAKCFLH
jgi:hypothetical protein